MSSITLLLLKNADSQKQIIELDLEASGKRYEAYNLEHQVLQIVDKEVIFARLN